MRKEILLSLFIFVLLILFFLFPHGKTGPGAEKRVLRIYNWANYLPPSVIRTFERQENVRVQYDVFENLETLEAKLLAARSGYDIVFPPAWPTAALFIPAGAFSKLDKKALPNRRFLSRSMMKKLRTIDPHNAHLVPYLWGTTGIIYNERRLTRIAPGFPRDSWALLYDPAWLSKIAACHVTLLDSPADSFPNVLAYLGYPPTLQTMSTLEQSVQHLIKIRPWISKFDSSQVIQDLLSGTVCAAEAFSSYAHMAIAKAQKLRNGPKLVYVIPKEGCLMWIDVIAIPKDAPNKALAYKFINFLMKPEIMAKVTNVTYTANSIPDAKQWIAPEIRDNPTIYPSKAVKKKIFSDTLPTKAFERKRLRLWTKIKTGY